ncbi:MAG: carbohydrate kinase family protein [Anaerolineae bacterium]|nr:carbohydrate kinase family protein [Anaerolineae bacterium]
MDIIPRFVTDAGADLAAYLSPGRLSEVGPVALSTGGAVSNTGLNLKRLGIDTRLMGKIGDDLFGRAILDIVRRYGPELADGMIVDARETSSYTVVIDPPHIDRMFLHCGGANHTFGAADVRYDILAQARLFHLGYPPLLGRLYADRGREMIEVFRRAKATGVTTSLDMAMPDPAGPSGRVDWAGIMARCMPAVDLFLPSAEEWLFMVDRERYDRLSSSVGAEGMLAALSVDEVRALGRRALEMGAKVVLLKLGERGVYLRTADGLDDLGRAAPGNVAAWEGRELWAPCFVPDALVGTTGAGDATIAGFLAALLRGAAPERALLIAAAVGACNVEAADALSGVRTWADTLARIAAGWEQAPMSIPGWRVDTAGVWHARGAPTRQARQSVV